MSIKTESSHNRSYVTYATNADNQYIDQAVESGNIISVKPTRKRRPIPTLSPELEARFWSLVDKRGPTACWNWIGSKGQPNKSSQFYGVWNITIDGKETHLRPHRVSWTLKNGPIPDGLDLDHVHELCSSTLCCNPDHTEPVTTGVNVQRYYLSRTHCKRGHPIEQHGKPCRPCRTLKKREERARKAVITEKPFAALIRPQSSGHLSKLRIR